MLKNVVTPIRGILSFLLICYIIIILQSLNRDVCNIVMTINEYSERAYAQ